MRTLLEGRKIKDGIRAEALVLEIGAPTQQAGSYQMPARLLVRRPDREPYEVEPYSLYMKAEQWPLPGETVPLMVARDKPDQVRVVWDEVPRRDKKEIQRQVDEALAAGRIRPKIIAAHPDSTPYLHDLFSTSGDREGDLSAVELVERPASAERPPQ